MADITDLDGRRVSRVRIRDTSPGTLLSVSLEGNLNEFMNAELRACGGAVRAGIRATMRGMKREMDRQMRSAGIKMYKDGRREWWIAVLYNSKANGGLDTVGKVYSGFGKAAQNFENSATILPKRGSYLFIPSPEGFGRNITVRGLSSFKDKLAIVPSRRSSTLLVLLKSGGTPVVMGWLVKQVRIKKKIQFAAAAEKWADSMPALILQEWEKAVARGASIKITS